MTERDNKGLSPGLIVGLAISALMLLTSVTVALTPVIWKAGQRDRQVSDDVAQITKTNGDLKTSVDALAVELRGSDAQILAEMKNVREEQQRSWAWVGYLTQRTTLIEKRVGITPPPPPFLLWNGPGGAAAGHQPLSPPREQKLRPQK